MPKLFCFERFFLRGWLVCLAAGAAAMAGTFAPTVACAAEPDEPEVFSGPQQGEPMVPFTVLGVYDQNAGKEFELGKPSDRPLLLVFVHDPVTRPSAALARGLAAYAQQNREKLDFALVWLKDDRSEAESYLTRARRSLNLGDRVFVSPDGAEGPGVLGLNREVSITTILAHKAQVVSNFALVQPASTDGPAILEPLARLIDAKVPSQDEFDRLCYGARAGRMEEQIPRELLAPVIRKDASEEQVEQAVRRVQRYVAANPASRQALGRIARTIVESGRLENYGTPAAQRHLRRWAEEFGGNEGRPNDPPRRDRQAPVSGETPRDAS